MTTALEIFAKNFCVAENSANAFSSFTGASDAFAALVLASRPEPRVVFAIVPGLPEADRLADDLKILAKNLPTRILEFPPPLTDDKASLGTRLKTLAALRAWAMNPYPCVVVMPFASVAAPVAAHAPDATLSLAAKTGAQKFSVILERLSAMGYRRMPLVEEEGDFSVRGGILDVWSPGEEFPVRLEFFGDELESLRLFDRASQRSIEKIATTTIMPIASDTDDPHATASVFDFAPPRCVLLALEHAAYALPEAHAEIFATRVYAGDPPPAGLVQSPFQTAPLPGFAELGADEAHHPELFDAARQRLARHLDACKQRGDTVEKMDELSGGFSVANLVVVTKADRVFTKRKVRGSDRAHASVGARINEFDELEPGEYVVHVDYGVGKFIGSSEILTDGKRCEVFTIEYADQATVHVPAAHAHLLSRYVGVKGESVRLHRLDGKKWTKDKANAQKAVNDLASALLETQARRELMPGYAYDVACDGREAFDAAFPYEETIDQRAAIHAIEHDLSATKPMDRLICGDAGYGKTEVAMRAAYIVAMNGRQVAVLAPTTVLAEQHFETFTSRFDGTPIRIESVSRFQSSDTHKGTFQRLATGACDIVIGTHAILSSKIAFKDLGLIIIDEEQRFGVRHKEFLKKMRETADVLTMSATPIPRTLYLSMTGAREMSLLRTPPRVRVAVETTVVRDSDACVKRAIEKELARGGQVFFLHNRVATIHKVEKRLRALVPQVRLVVAHGQMDARELARKMRKFERGEFDVLLSTTIIESGIDIPRANTILVDHAHLFGLADLYQLRGRVGRASRQGHAIFLLPSEGLIDSDARERLAALKRHGGLGAGFNLAVRDLELRGAGNLLGSQQSGHIAAIGFGLYCQFLQRTIAKMKGEKIREIVDVRLNFDFIDASPANDDDNDSSTAALPYRYIEEDAQRIGIMKRLASVMSVNEVRQIENELVDRFGPLPAASARLLRVATVRVKAAEAHFSRIDVREKRIFFYRADSAPCAMADELKGRTADQKLSEILTLIARARKKARAGNEKDEEK